MSLELNYISNEILMIIFTFLSPKALLRCRIICWKWREIIDCLTRNEKLWREHCRRDYPDICDTAYLKSTPGLTWYQLYRSLALWPKLLQAQETTNDLVTTKNPFNEIKTIQLLRDGVVAVQKREEITYFDANKLLSLKGQSIFGKYDKFGENDNIILLLNHNLLLNVTLKGTSSSTLVTLPDVTRFLLMENGFYYVTVHNCIYLSKLANGKITSVMLKHIPDGVKLLAIKNESLHILTYKHDVYALIQDELRNLKHCNVGKSMLYMLRKYNFLQQMDWRITYEPTNCLYTKLQFSVGKTYTLAASYDIVTMCAYGPVVFCGSSLGVLRIYYSPNMRDACDLLDAVPLKQYNFMKESDISPLSIYPILQIDVIEGKDSHTVVVALPKQVVVINFTHDFEFAESACN